MSQSGGLGIAIIEAAEPARASGCRRSSRSATRPICRATTCSSTGSRTRAPRSRCSTSSRSATRGSSPGSPAEFARRKPLLAVKSGRSAAGARATSSHTGALLSASDVTVDALFEQAGVIRTDTMHELFDVAAAADGAAASRAATASRSSPTPAARASCARTPARPTASTSPSCRQRVQPRLAEFLPDGRRGRQPDRHDRDGDRRRLPADARRR